MFPISSDSNQPAPQVVVKPATHRGILVVIALFGITLVVALFSLIEGPGTAEVLELAAKQADQLGVLSLSEPISGGAGEKWASLLREYEESETVRAVLIQINSPGGTVGTTQMLADIIKRIQAAGKPVYSTIADVGASGAYWLASQTDKIFVQPGSTVGSIGVVRQGFSIQQLMETYGVKDETIAVGEYKTSGNMFKTMTEDERTYMLNQMEEIYKQFLSAVLNKRKGKGTPEITESILATDLAEGRVFNGSFAVEHGLADAYGAYDEAKKEIEAALKQKGIIGNDEELKRYEPMRGSILDRLGGLPGFEGATLPSPLHMFMADYAGLPLVIHAGAIPPALWLRGPE